VVNATAPAIQLQHQHCKGQYDWKL